jgi:hypothetical protein
MISDGDYWIARFERSGEIACRVGDPVDIAAELGTLWRYRNPGRPFELRMELDPISFEPLGRGVVLAEGTWTVLDRYTMRRVGVRREVAA